jgi:uncharacterized protein YndB with AHSA1/START domain
MTDEQPKTRSIEREIEIDAPIEDVWKAITEAEEITRWFSEEARVTPGVGGSYWVSWGEGQSGDSRIEVWEPGRRLRVRNLPWEAKEGLSSQYNEDAASATAIIQEYTLETRGGKTILRVVDSGMPDSPEWDGMYDGKTRGWEMFFYALRHYLQKHRGEPRRNIVEMRPISVALIQAWEKITGPEGLAAGGSFEGAVAGTRYSVTTSLGDALQGEVLINLPPKTLSITIENLNDALMSATFEEMGGTTYIYFTLATYGMDAQFDNELRERWTGLLNRLFPAS